MTGQQKTIALIAGGCVALTAVGAVALVVAAILVLGTRPATSPPGPVKPSGPAVTGERRPGFARGRAHGADGQPIRVPGARITITVSGTSRDGIPVTYHPPVDAEGHYETKIIEGRYSKVVGEVGFTFDGKAYRLPLHPVQDVQGDQQAENGVVQDFVWKLAGPKPGMQADERTGTGWYGASISMLFARYREDVKKGVSLAPPGAKAIFVVTPNGALADGSQGQPLTFERLYDATLLGLSNGTLPDIPLGVYSVTGHEVLSDGSRRPLLFFKGDVYGDSTEVRFVPNYDGFWAAPVSFTRPD